MLLVCEELVDNINVDLYSVLYQFLMVFQMNPTTLVFSNYYLIQLTGTVLPNSTCIWMGNDKKSVNEIILYYTNSGIVGQGYQQWDYFYEQWDYLENSGMSHIVPSGLFLSPYYNAKSLLTNAVPSCCICSFCTSCDTAHFFSDLTPIIVVWVGRKFYLLIN